VPVSPRLRWLFAVLLGVLMVAAGPRPARAYPSGSQFDVSDGWMSQDLSDGLVFTGSPRFAGHGCEVCHTGAPHRIGVRIEADVADLFSRGWEPGAQYHMRVVMTGEWAGTAYAAFGDDCGDPDHWRACDDNGFALEIDDAAGRPVTLDDGRFLPVYQGQCGNPPAPHPGELPPVVDAYVLGDGSAVASAGVGSHARTSWEFCWVAPKAGRGPLTLYVGAVDGNGGDGTFDNPSDTEGDDVFVAALPLDERAGGGVATENGSCAIAAGGGRAPGWPALLLVVAALVGVRRARRTLLVALLAVGLFGGAGCATVRPWQKERLAKRIMKFAPDPDEDELDQHMLEAREGSAGGYGSAGGGCGCN
jgi:hypothetical protein